MTHQIMLQKTAKMVFASNVPTDMAEDKIREFFARAGHLLSFRIICDKDKETGKTKAYAICEYKDQDTAVNAVRTLSMLEIAGRYMKVDHALNEKSRLEMISVMQHAQNPDSSSEKTPETISKAVASLPPEQMFELLKQMKQCIQNNSGEAKNMLLQNPQLAYALLQALVVMRVVDPFIALTALNNASNSLAAVSTLSGSISDSTISASSMINRISSSISAAANVPAHTGSVASVSGKQYSNTQQTSPLSAQSIPIPPAPVVHDIDIQGKPSEMGRLEQEKSKTAVSQSEIFKRDPRLHQPRTVTPASGLNPVSTTTSSASRVMPSMNVPAGQASSGSKTTAASNTPDNEKAALIMQVLRLTEAQIAMLPPEQRQSILLLKEKIAKSAKR